MLMIILLHVFIAITSIVIASVSYFKPSVKNLAVSYGFIIATIGTGTYLLLSTPGNILKSCLVGLAYITIVTVVTIAAHMRLKKLAPEYVSRDEE